MILIDAHADTLYRMAMEPGKACDLSLDRLKAGGVSLQVLAMYVGGDPDPSAIRALFTKMRQGRLNLLKEGWTQADDPAEAREGEVRFMLSVEGCEPFEDGLEAIREYREMGVRMAAVTWNYENARAHPPALS